MSALAVGGFSEILGWMEKKTPLRRNVSGKEVGDAAAFLLSEHGTGITGQTLHVDCGYSSIGL
jgi:enoyl-[acyl-carrier protein] reductase I